MQKAYLDLNLSVPEFPTKTVQGQEKNQVLPNFRYSEKGSKMRIGEKKLSTITDYVKSEGDSQGQNQFHNYSKTSLPFTPGLS